MSGSPERKSEEVFVNPKIKVIMETYKVNEEVATKLSIDVMVIAQEQMKKWCRNTRKIQRNRADDIYRLIKKFIAENPTLANNLIIVEIQKKLLELFTDDFGC